MNKLNKKGFTLIEMLVVIAIIAVLVSIIIPTVTSATDKAAAATNAANLRSIKAEIVTAMLTNDEDYYTFTTSGTGTSATTTVSLTSGTSKTLPELKDVDVCTDPTWAVSVVGSEVTVYAKSGSSYYTIQAFADFAEGEDLAAAENVPASVADIG